MRFATRSFSKSLGVSLNSWVISTGAISAYTYTYNPLEVGVETVLSQYRDNIEKNVIGRTRNHDQKHKYISSDEGSSF